MLPPSRTHRLDVPVDPADAFAALFPTGDAVWLDSGPDAEAGRSVIGTGTRLATASVADGTVTVDGRSVEGDILDALRDEPAATDGYPLGWIGWLGYEAGAAALGVPYSAGPGLDAAFLYVDRLVVFDHADGSVTVVDATPEGEWLGEAVAALAGASGAAARFAKAHPIPTATPAPRWRHSGDIYLTMIAACQDAIRAGDAYQLCLTNTATAATSADPLAVHLRLRRDSPAHHAGFLRIAGETLVSSSPEQFLLVTPDGHVRTKPIKGTRPRGATVAEDLRLRAELEASEKEQAENVMIVDLMRNDLGRVCEVGSVGVRHLLEVESYAQVHQLVSTVEGRLRPGLTAVDALAAAFPAGSMTGAPKLSAMRILAGLEAGPRGVYSGCFGSLAADGSADLAMVIRSLRFRDGVVTIGAGGGITALSVPAEELDEVDVKAAALFRAAGLRPPGNGSDTSNV
ncbi:anthranilate synthase component I family protein [Leifsonia shinshuensis]|uniref:Anthranilate synthase component I family protein n=1 Tax=Leifsonia shinshuensis TaxID=150026 RepID=A0A7G6Y6W2_9MICO|nr:anthranilate synthase component I family protein [Leifsonia shinshuensis]QNE34227.1 anthranilate synthase component I family protein [Leifsonia shinshuensis]